MANIYKCWAIFIKVGPFWLKYWPFLIKNLRFSCVFFTFVITHWWPCKHLRTLTTLLVMGGDSSPTCEFESHGQILPTNMYNSHMCLLLNCFWCSKRRNINEKEAGDVPFKKRNVSNHEEIFGHIRANWWSSSSVFFFALTFRKMIIHETSIPGTELKWR